MTINAASNNPRVEYTVGQGVEQKVFTIPFEFFEDPEVKLYVDGTLKTQGSGDGKYTVTGGEGSTGTATFNTVSSGTQPVTGATGGSTVIIVRDIPIERVTDFSAGADINRAALNTQLDTLTALVSDADTNILRTLTAPVTDANINMALPAKDTRKGRVLAFNATTGNPEQGPEIADVTTLAAVTADIATLANIEDGTDATDAIQTVAGIAANVTSVAGISANVTSVAAKASLITSDFVSDLNTLATSAIVEDLDILATSDIVSDLNQLATTDFVSDLNAVEGIKTDVSTVASNVSNVSSFANRYRIASSDPSSSLDAGDLAYNTTSNVLKYYNGSSWQTIQLTSGISSGNVATFASGVADNDFLRIDGTSVEGRSASEVLSDIGAQAALTFGISNTNAVKIDSASVADDEYARFTANGLESRSTSEVLSDIGGTTATAAADEATALAIALG